MSSIRDTSLGFWEKYHSTPWWSWGKGTRIVEMFQEILVDQLESTVPFSDAGWGNIAVEAIEPAIFDGVQFRVRFEKPHPNCDCCMWFIVSVSNEMIFNDKHLDQYFELAIKTQLLDSRREYEDHAVRNCTSRRKPK